jgi:hypothetical protein
MFEFKTLIVTKRGFRAPRNEGGEVLVPFSVHKFAITSEQDVKKILAHPSIAGWKYGYSIGYSRESL